MASRPTWQTADQFFSTGRALFTEARYDQALAELQRAEHAFRSLDARGAPCTRPLSNGISGLANTLALAGKCHQALGTVDAAIACFELSFINGSFERRAPFERFQRDVHAHLTACYEAKLAAFGPASSGPPFSGDAPIDASFLFPFSLDPVSVPAARLFEIAPDRFPQYRDGYERARERDRSMRSVLTGPAGDAPSLRNSAAVAWTILGALWIAYSFVAVKTLFAP